MRNNHQEKKSGSTATPGNTGQYSNPLTATLTGIRDLWKKGKPTLLLSETDRLDGKTVMITGASSGLGFAAALDLSKRGATVIMACRSGIPGKGEAVKAATGSSKVFMEQVDLSNLDSIAELTQRINAQYGRIDILICNAAMVPSKSRRNEQGLEEMFVVNYLAKYLMVRLLIQNGAFGDIDKRKHPAKNHFCII